MKRHVVACSCVPISPTVKGTHFSFVLCWRFVSSSFRLLIKPCTLPPVGYCSLCTKLKRHHSPLSWLNRLVAGSKIQPWSTLILYCTLFNVEPVRLYRWVGSTCIHIHKRVSGLYLCIWVTAANRKYSNTQIYCAFCAVRLTAAVTFTFQKKKNSSSCRIKT